MKVCKAIATLVLVIAVTNSTRCIAQNGPPPTPSPPTTVSSVGTIAEANEPGERLEISGQVFSPDGVTPVANVIVYAYQTDATGRVS
jgi:protocatechuate 3,4-dioxygenase beta subunit